MSFMQAATGFEICFFTEVGSVERAWPRFQVY